MRHMLLVLAVLTGAQSSASLLDRVDGYLRENADALTSVRHDLHQHPELSGAEVRTASVIADHLRKLGLEIRTDVGGHGVVAVLNGGRPGPLVAYRADMDAVRSTAADSVPFASQTPGVRHLCGHDLHMTVALGLAGALASIKADLPGRVMFIFQPAEERATGAQAMLADGLFSDPERTPVAIYGVHTSPYEVGQLSVKAGVMMLPGGSGVPGATNDPALTLSAKAATTARFGADAMIDLQEPPEGFSEDFGWYQKRVPGVFFFLGASNTAAGVAAMPHSPDFALDDGAIVFGARAMAAVLLDRLTSEPR